MTQTAFVSCKLLNSRDQYQTCHIVVPDLQQPLAAIQLGDRYYGLFQTLTDSERVLRVLVKLHQRGDEVVVTKAGKGYSLWVWEPEASRKQATATKLTTVPPASFRLLVSPDRVPFWSVQVPDLGQSLQAVEVSGEYYSLFRLERTVDRLFEIVAKITQQGDVTIVFEASQGYAVCVLEPDAQPIQRISSRAFFQTTLQPAEPFSSRIPSLAIA
ncbi:hypothetical protein OOK60_05250 [Trichothermofontia sichuanensis B231]|uniref:hypothetical protein n=1 Tax=Trichothermofontia sichuanensis TaxID=3045816 RepID=UPI0022455E13|nr:hypothetical protein [Trichothermofontia sichuanensis]UZQ55481.1 hypothetical protein OOK60_05250 [Trichothermofontia sichuanensis B231]